MKRLVLTLVLGLSAMVWAVGGDMGSGDGSADNPYLIEDLADFDAFAANSAYWAAGIHTKLMTDIDLSGRTYTTAVIAPDTDNSQYYFQGVSFSGVFKGMGYTIKNLTINSGTNSYLGLFGEIGEDGFIMKLGVESCSINGHHYLGGLSGSCFGEILNCHATGFVSGSNILIGGLVGRNSGIIRDSYSNCEVHGTYAGGLVGGNYDRISYCYSTGNVSGGDNVGGLVGFNSGTINVCYSTGNVNGNSYVGGLAGRNSRGRIEQCFSRGSAIGSSDVGGLIGYHEGTIVSQCYSTGYVSGSVRVGGLIGRGPTSTVYYPVNCYWDKETSGRSFSVNGIGLTSLQMKDINTYLSGGWDFLNENVNGTCNYWLMPHDDYPVLSLFNGYVPPEPEGSGTLAYPYLISDINDFGTMWYRPSAHYVLTNDIDFFGTEWSIPVVPEFSGTLNGNGFFIRNLAINGSRIFQGLFGKISNGKILELGIIDSSVRGSYWVGSLVGYNNDSIIDNCSAACSVTGERGVGGLIGISNGNISNSHSTGDVGGVFYVGGLVGEHGDYNSPCGNIENCYSTGNVEGRDGVGGLVGYNFCGYICLSHSTGTVSGIDSYVGGLVGINKSIIEKCHSACMVNGLSSVGGLAGMNDQGRISQSYSSGSVIGHSNIGGLVGWNYRYEIDNCYATGNVEGIEKVGGLVGFSDGYYSDMDYVYCGTIVNSYSIGNVTGTSDLIGGLVGSNYRIEHENITNCFWNTDTSNLYISAGGTPMNDSNMMIQVNFVGWDFSDTDGDWMMLREGEDYPRLAWQAVFSGDVAGLYGVDFVDFAYLAQYWGLTDCGGADDCGRADIDGSGDVGIGDLVYVAEDWLKGR